MKTNYDGAMFRESNEAGIGVVIWNSEDKVLAAISEKIVKPPTVEVLELLAARRAVSFTAESGFTNFIYEGDFDSAVQSIRSKGMENSQGMHLIKDIQSHVNSF